MTDNQPCPFCGCNALVTNSYRNDLWKVECAGEQCSMSPETDVYRNKEAAIRIWNTRKTRAESRTPAMPYQEAVEKVVNAVNKVCYSNVPFDELKEPHKSIRKDLLTRIAKAALAALGIVEGE